VKTTLEDRTIFVTGGSRGIGAAIVSDLALAGARVFFTYERAADRARALVEALPASSRARVIFERCDMSDPIQLERSVDACLAQFGALDVLVNNAGIFAENPFDGDDFAAWRAGWRRTFDVNLFGAADLCWIALRAMRRNAPDARGVRGRIVNVTSRAAHRGETTFADYGASKSALGNLTRSLARGCARDGIVAFAVAPGFIETEMACDAIAEYRDYIERDIPGGRIGTPEEVASIVASLATGAFDYATGTTIDVNGASYVR
jgi:NAD(P)-dependent dehydrogenase (short-subunit alcohol dehydrogenase family)